MMAPPNCYDRKCKHYQGVRYLGEDESTEVVHCKAFPDGIPNEIAYGDNEHLTPFPGDRGILYER